MNIKYIKRDSKNMITSISNRPQVGFVGIESTSQEWIEFEAKTGRYEVVKTYLENRIEAYGTPAEQLEFIAESGSDAFAARQAEIKAQFPAPVS